MNDFIIISYFSYIKNFLVHNKLIIIKLLSFDALTDEIADDNAACI